MGLDIFFVTKTKKPDRLYEGLSRDFGYFVCGPGAFGDNCEFYQVEKILNMDLSILLKSASLSPPIEDLEYEMYLAEENNNKEEVEEIKRRIEDFSSAWHKNYPNDIADWTKLSDLKEVVINFRNAITKNPDYHLELNYNMDWSDYFTLNPPETESQTRLYLDLDELIHLISKAESMNEEFATFDFG